MSSGTLYNASGSYEQSFLAGARPSGNVTSGVSRCCTCLLLLLPPGLGFVNAFICISSSLGALFLTHSAQGVSCCGCPDTGRWCGSTDMHLS